MKPASCKAKGRKAANEVKALIHQLFPELGDDDVIRTSGGQIGEDIQLSPKARGFLPISIEVKNVETLLTVLGWKAIAQAEENAKEWQPVVVFRKNGQPLRAIIDFAELLALLRIHAAFQMSQDTHEVLKNGHGN
jgi:hypothetical protein